MPSVRQDLFPAVVGISAPGDTRTAEELSTIPFSKDLMMVTSARVLVTNDRVTVVTDSPGGPQVVFSQPIDPARHFKSQDVRTKDSFVVTTSGMVVVFRKDEGCGCGSRLRSWRPYGTSGSSSIYDPTE